MQVWLANLVVIIHFVFVAFVVSGGLLLFISRKMAILHIPAVIWGVVVEYTGWICPLTPLENMLRCKAGLASYKGGFIENYILPVLYPSGLTHNIQIILGSILVLINLVIYFLAFRSNLPIFVSKKR